MSATRPGPETTEAVRSCPRCGAPLRPDQDWCLNCGTAVTTEVAGPPGWRAPIAIVGLVLMLAAAALVFAFLEISDDADRVAQAPAPTPTAPPPTPTPATTPTATPTPTPTPATGTTPGTTPTPAPGTSPTPTVSPTPTTTPATGTFASWPAGRTAWTVVLYSARTRDDAESKARSFQSSGRSVGILDSDDYSSLNPGYWVVFSGQYDTREQAQSAAEGWQSTANGAYARQVKPA